MSVNVIERSGRTSRKAVPSWPQGPEPEREAAPGARLCLLEGETPSTAPLSVVAREPLSSWPQGPSVNENFSNPELDSRIPNLESAYAFLRVDSLAAFSFQR